MENYSEELTEKQMEQIICAIKEETIIAEDLLKEIKLFLNDFILGLFKTESNGMTYEPYNGQKFLIQITEIA